MKSFSIYLISLFALSTALIEVVIQLTETIHLRPWMHYTNIFYALLTLILYTVSSIGMRTKNHSIFVKTVGISTFLRLIFSVVFLFTALIFSGLEAKQYIIGYIILYFIYMVFEIKLLVPNLRPDSAHTQNDGDARK